MGSIFGTHFWDPLLGTFVPHLLGLRSRQPTGQPNTPEVTISVAGFLLEKWPQIRARSLKNCVFARNYAELHPRFGLVSLVLVAKDDPCFWTPTMPAFLPRVYFVCNDGRRTKTNSSLGARARNNALGCHKNERVKLEGVLNEPKGKGGTASWDTSATGTTGEQIHEVKTTSLCTVSLSTQVNFTILSPILSLRASEHAPSCHHQRRAEGGTGGRGGGAAGRA